MRVWVTHIYPSFAMDVGVAARQASNASCIVAYVLRSPGLRVMSLGISLLGNFAGPQLRFLCPLLSWCTAVSESGSEAGSQPRRVELARGLEVMCISWKCAAIGSYKRPGVLTSLPAHIHSTLQVLLLDNDQQPAEGFLSFVSFRRSRVQGENKIYKQINPHSYL